MKGRAFLDPHDFQELRVVPCPCGQPFCNLHWIEGLGYWTEGAGLSKSQAMRILQTSENFDNLQTALEQAIQLLWEHAGGLTAHIEPLEAALEASYGHNPPGTSQ